MKWIMLLFLFNYMEGLSADPELFQSRAACEKAGKETAYFHSCVRVKIVR